MGVRRLDMEQKTIKISFNKARSVRGGIVQYVYSFMFSKLYGLDPEKPIYITPDYINRSYYIDGWEIEDETKKIRLPQHETEEKT